MCGFHVFSHCRKTFTWRGLTQLPEKKLSSLHEHPERFATNILQSLQYPLHYKYIATNILYCLQYPIYNKYIFTISELRQSSLCYSLSRAFTFSRHTILSLIFLISKLITILFALCFPCNSLRFYSEPRLNFDDADSFCNQFENRGSECRRGHLVAIDSNDENEFILNWWKTTRPADVGVSNLIH